MMNTIKIALSGLMAASNKTEATASNIANLNTTGSLDDTAETPPYKAQTTTQTAVTDQEGNGLGVKSDITAKDPAFVPSYQPGSPFADSDGLVGVPNVNLAEEAVNLSLAETTFKANVSVIETAAEMSEELLETFDEEV